MKPLRWPIRLTRGIYENGGAPLPGWSFRSGGSGGGWRFYYLFQEDPDGALWIEWFIFDWIGVRVLITPSGELPRSWSGYGNR